MTVPVVLDARIMAYNRTGISRYIRHLYEGMASLRDSSSAGSDPFPIDVTVLSSRRDAEHLLAAAWGRSAIGLTPPHHRLERVALSVEIARILFGAFPARSRARPVLHSPDHVCPEPLSVWGARQWATVVTVHDLSFLRVPYTHSVESRRYYSGIHRTVRTAERIICPSQATAADLLDMTTADSSRIRVIHEAPDPRYVEVGPAFRSVDTQRPYILTVGSIEKRKNIKLLIEAIATMSPAERPDVKIVGSPGSAYEDCVKEVSRNSLTNRVEFLGRVSTEMIASLYRGAAAMVYPSLYEGFGLPVVEAMACGAPVITSTSSCLPEVAGDAAILVAPEDVDGLRDAILKVIGDPSLASGMRARGLRRAASFSWERAATETVAVFLEASRA
ncbi:MAG: glycosyltransferase family 1 protein [Chloroflexi bacterium]|nr:glycosyltransferase family 1 protein [Chloroflexota bacterium]